MKKVLTVALILLSLTAFAQDPSRSSLSMDSIPSRDDTATLTTRLVFSSRGYNSNYFAISGSAPQHTTTLVDERQVLILIKGDGDMYYTPSAFCSCRKCRKHKGMKFLKNIYK